MKKRNPLARLVRDPRFKSKVVKSKKVYTRKGRPNKIVSWYKKGLGVSD